MQPPQHRWRKIGATYRFVRLVSKKHRYKMAHYFSFKGSPALNVKDELIKSSLFFRVCLWSSTNLFPFVTIQVLFLLYRLRRQGGEDGRGHPAPRQGALLAPWNPLLNSHFPFLLQTHKSGYRFPT